MVELFAIVYMTEKEAAARYGYSKSWFQRRRHFKQPPAYVKLNNKGRIYYPVEATDRWFQANLKQSDE